MSGFFDIVIIKQGNLAQEFHGKQLMANHSVSL